MLGLSGTGILPVGLRPPTATRASRHQCGGKPCPGSPEPGYISATANARWPAAAMN
jgi:hypothetical protein